jgi:hypothetical protein
MLRMCSSLYSAAARRATPSLVLPGLSLCVIPVLSACGLAGRALLTVCSGRTVQFYPPKQSLPCCRSGRLRCTADRDPRKGHCRRSIARHKHVRQPWLTISQPGRRAARRQWSSRLQSRLPHSNSSSFSNYSGPFGQYWHTLSPRRYSERGPSPWS